jgi:hypothetical protein
VDEWLADYNVGNVFVFDFYNVLTTNGGDANTSDAGLASGNHHRWWNGGVQHKTDGDEDANSNVLEYPTGDNHPSRAGNQKATTEFAPLLNNVYGGSQVIPEFSGLAVLTVLTVLILAIVFSIVFLSKKMGTA